MNIMSSIAADLSDAVQSNGTLKDACNGHYNHMPNLGNMWYVEGTRDLAAGQQY